MKIISSSWIQYDRLNDIVIDHAIDKHNMKILYNKKLEPTCIPPGFNRHYKIHDVQRYYVKYGTDIHTLHLVEKAYDDKLNMLYETHEIQDEHDRYWELISRMVNYDEYNKCYYMMYYRKISHLYRIIDITLTELKDSNNNFDGYGYVKSDYHILDDYSGERKILQLMFDKNRKEIYRNYR